VILPEASSSKFWLNGSAWQFPTFENADTFVDRLVREGLLVHDPAVDAALQGQPPDLSPRMMQYRFLQATGLPHRTIDQIERARRALSLLQHGTSILDVVEEAGYSDQPHLTRALKQYMGQTPAQVVPTLQVNSL
jgi:methylphosphotriester-DNA--protein-cysteine methyltransferase